MAINTPADLTVNLFKNQLNGEINKLIEDKGFENPGRAFQYWYFKNIWNFEDDLIDEIDTDGGQDQGIDAIFIDEDNIVHFFQFKNIKDINKNYPQGEAEKTFAGIVLLQSGEYHELVNKKLKLQFEAVMQSVRKHYVVHLISSAQELAPDAKNIFDIRIKEFNRYGEKYSLSVTDIGKLSEEHTRKLRFKVPDAIIFPNVLNPYFTRSREHTSYLFTCSGRDIAEIYEKYKDKLLEQNVRANLGKKNSTNAAIYNSCTSENSNYFCHFNNGITFSCDSSEFDAFQNKVIITGAQIVNGGQTASTLYQAYKDGKLKDDVSVPVRTINTDKDVDFASNVAINLNNQTKIDSSFLKSNHPIMLRIQDDLRRMGYIFERRGFEFDNLDDDKKKALEKKYGSDFSKLIIPQRESAKAYVTFIKQQIQLAKKDSGKIFVDISEGGEFENVFDGRFSTLKLLLSYIVFTKVDFLIDEFSKDKRKKNIEAYIRYTSLGITDNIEKMMSKILPQSTIFITGLLYELKFKKSEENSGEYVNKFLEYFSSNYLDVIKETIDILITYFTSGEIDDSRTTDSLIKSQTVYNSMIDYVKRNNLPRELDL